MDFFNDIVNLNISRISVKEFFNKLTQITKSMLYLLQEKNMGFFKWLFSLSKTILKTEIVAESDGLDEDDKLTNLAVGEMMDGFDGMVFADIYNQEHSATTTFRVTYTDGTSELIETENGSSQYRKFMKYLVE